MRLFFSEGCPYAQRSRALLQLLDVPFEPRPIDLAAKPADFLALSPTGKVPLLEHDGFVLYESAVINEYLADAFSWRAGLQADAKGRARDRLAMLQFDAVVTPLFFRLAKAPEQGTPEVLAPALREIDELGRTVAGRPAESLIGLHLAPFWLRFTWFRPESTVVQALREAAGDFLDRAAAQAAIVATSPDREVTVRHLQARFGG
jgi:glutathione S-transferase